MQPGGCGWHVAFQPSPPLLLIKPTRWEKCSTYRCGTFGRSRDQAGTSQGCDDGGGPRALNGHDQVASMPGTAGPRTCASKCRQAVCAGGNSRRINFQEVVWIVAEPRKGLRGKAKRVQAQERAELTCSSCDENEKMVCQPTAAAEYVDLADGRERTGTRAARTGKPEVTGCRLAGRISTSERVPLEWHEEGISIGRPPLRQTGREDLPGHGEIEKKDWTKPGSLWLLHRCCSIRV
jgi:hypothetical protein